MKIKAVEVENQYVEFCCSFGSGVAKCSEENLSSGMIYDVEMDINITLKIGYNTDKNIESNLYLRNDGKTNWLNGLVESIDDDDTICLRLANDCIVMAEYEECEVHQGDVLLITISKEDLEITLIGVSSS
jgi:hypothetical protein